MKTARDFIATDQGSVTPTTVRIEKSISVSFAQCLNDIRTWLDNQKIKIQPLDFKPLVTQEGFSFELRFRTDEEAQRFKNAFP